MTLKEAYRRIKNDECNGMCCVPEGESCIKGCQWLVILEALEKQIPKKPLEKHYEGEGEPPYIKYCCPKGCNVQLYPSRKGETLYCYKCGQKIDWR